MAGGGGSTESGEPEFQVAPMIDVLLTILVFFMAITTTQVLKVDKTIKLPLAPDAQKKESQRSELILNVKLDESGKKGVFVYDGKNYTKTEDLVPLLKQAARDAKTKIVVGENPVFRAVIRGDRNVPAIYVSQAMNACGDAGISEISFSATNKD